MKDKVTIPILDRASEIQSLFESYNLFVTTLNAQGYHDLIPRRGGQFAPLYEALGLGHIEESRKKAVMGYDGFGFYVFTNATKEEAPLFHERNMVSSREGGKVTPSKDFDYTHAQILCEKHRYPDFAMRLAEAELQS
jgi:hypothetical protein